MGPSGERMNAVKAIGASIDKPGRLTGRTAKFRSVKTAPGGRPN